MHVLGPQLGMVSAFPLHQMYYPLLLLSQSFDVDPNNMCHLHHAEYEHQQTPYSCVSDSILVCIEGSDDQSKLLRVGWS